ncbi:hypothetical protein PoB_006963600 [Plakobranchus ocellatus]|uniref:Uncharacterized protein n=1 Tax=Plakobranchus ocellatus TaxID=259542 RepID=A0AAV4DG32_9GAST|nr:hypothetical protein PoB_006963600 [Plakobranchus ocellatus]
MPSKYQNHCQEQIVIQIIFSHVQVTCKTKGGNLKKVKANLKFQMDLLKSYEKSRDEFAVAVHNKHETLDNISEIEALWSEMKKSRNEFIEKHVPKKDTKEQEK